ncbi:hypothetical protein A2276_06500 [candidate division WOR-1 bacterium RIFOXYA12_FULL_43_27]|uniref:Uncharacterized protein n=1 Tax=candidate division WOR-1 bacterium RIFOXYC2_FULL_46_14 TaxID=1802587 RepID=A0A1F4U5B5_UNCSA|nr:MAG: hypothetical protein A2276_06500 [candidate division WOR-1 bacterium RIFOXYA12_FULL_43_27]OGC20298.1 MAG: hypothetical protein A2292_04500 [candidate division WOR-1 bacterium RIFOXYB2_FULL_46_45]OGC31965.1 MAG: hypothetical protein A2232_06950 [candidate division WOR-1 bacterium RIFOXYA2_FULL_46_56]OGC40144.1 MAG: hypothetical protein A2438_02520 [candidate division WOR-1 bacterium RIFOXYC2_FULL_46_14]
MLERKKIFLVFCLMIFMACSAGAAGFKDVDPEKISFKAGPTDPAEDLSIPWVEVSLYPKNVEAGGQFSVKAALASKVKEVSAVLDDKEKYALKPEDQSGWDAAIVLPSDLKSGLHFLKVNITGNNGKTISRTLVFRVLGNASRAEISFPVTFKSDTRLSKGRSVTAGEKGEAIYRQTYYWVKGPDGAEGWIEASGIEESKREIYVSAYQAFTEGDYDRAIVYYSEVVILDPNDADAYYWLAKAYQQVGEEQEVIKALKTALAIDPQHSGANWMAGRVAKDDFSKGIALLRMKKYQEAAEAIENASSLRPGSISYWMQLGKIYGLLGDTDAASEAWKQVLLIDPDNQQAHALLKTDYYRMIAKEEPIEPAAPKIAAETASSQYVNMVKQSRTEKGTLVGSALKSVVSMAKSLGTKIDEEGWKASWTGNSFLVTYACRQERLGKTESELFSFKVDPDSRRVEPYNKNARLLVSRW